MRLQRRNEPGSVDWVATRHRAETLTLDFQAGKERE